MTAAKPGAGLAHAELVEVTRGGHVESIHAGSVAVVDLHGRLLFSAGDPECLTFTRSAIKPFQAAPFIAAGGAAAFSLTQRELALLCASHTGEDMHVSAVRSILEKSGCTEAQLRCGCHVPLRYTLDALPPAGAQFTQVHHNCSGKHAGFLAYCVQHGLPREDYLHAEHPLQQAVRRSVAAHAGLAPEQLASGIDGCSAPNYAMPLSRLALAFGRLAAGGKGSGGNHAFGAADATLRDAMMAHPELMSGTGRTDVAFMRAMPGECVAKIGAEGVQAIGLRKAGIGIAIKVADGNARALVTTAIAVLEELKLLPDPAATPLAPWARPQSRNYAGQHTGEIRAVVRLQPRA